MQESLPLQVHIHLSGRLLLLDRLNAAAEIVEVRRIDLLPPLRFEQLRQIAQEDAGELRMKIPSSAASDALPEFARYTAFRELVPPVGTPL